MLYTLLENCFTELRLVLFCCIKIFVEITEKSRAKIKAHIHWVFISMDIFQSYFVQSFEKFERILFIIGAKKINKKSK